MNLTLDTHEAAFRAEVRAFLRDNLTDDLREAQALTAGVYPEPDVALAWQARLADRGWAAPLWPTEQGGTGWTGIQRFIFETESALAGAPQVYPIGLRLLGPVLIAFGTDEQKAEYLPKILSGEHYWCQGFSEPGAGSDLASLATRAVPHADGYLVSGSKIWTTHAHHATHMFTLVRTDASARKQDGISMLLIDLRAPGVEIRPIISIGGEHDVNQVFLQDVQVPKSCLLGEENSGWNYAKYLLEYERGAGLVAGRLRSSLKRIYSVIEQRAAEGSDPREDSRLMDRLSEAAMDVDVFEFLELQTLGPLELGANPGPVSSVLKLRASRLKQTIAEIGATLLGADGTRWPEVIAQRQDALLPDYLNSRAATIFGGAKEVQLSIIAKSLGL